MTKSRVSALSNDNAKDLRNGAKESEKAAKGVTNPKEAILKAAFTKAPKVFRKPPLAKNERRWRISRLKKLKRLKSLRIVRLEVHLADGGQRYKPAQINLL